MEHKVSCMLGKCSHTLVQLKSFQDSGDGAVYTSTCYRTWESGSDALYIPTLTCNSSIIQWRPLASQPNQPTSQPASQQTSPPGRKGLPQQGVSNCWEALLGLRRHNIHSNMDGVHSLVHTSFKLQAKANKINKTDK